MDDINEKRFSYLRELSKDEKINMIKDLEEEIIELEKAIKDKKTSSEQVSELYSDISYNRSKIAYLNNILEERHM